ncbi:CBN-GST-8 protein [Aphelenchoides avenae]|nr:CBN-GST-8 protein [Aphelenchus avenae]
MIYKFYYFDARGLGEFIRMLFKYANVDFEDIRIARDDWPAMKPKMPFGEIPVLEVDNKQLAQSYTIARYLARKFELAGNDEWEAAKIDEIADLHADFRKEILPYVYTVHGYRKGDKEALHKDFVAGMEKFMPLFARVLKATGSGFFTNKPSWVDFLFSEYSHTIEKFDKAQFDKYAELLEHRKRVESLPQLKDYLATRPDMIV